MLFRPWVNCMATLLQDLRYGLRVLLKSPAFSAAAVLVLALGIGANTAIFSVVNAVLLRPLPFRDADRLVMVWHVPPPQQFPGEKTFSVAPANYFDWRAQNHVFQNMALYTGENFTLTGSGQPQSVLAATVEPQFFSVLQAAPMLGRALAPGEDAPGHNHIVVLSYGLWKQQFGGDRDIVGKNISLNGVSYTVAGVMDQRFTRPSYAQMWTPLVLSDAERAVRGEHHFSVIARLRDGVSLEQAQAEMSAISARLAQQYPADDKDWGALVRPLREELVGDVRPALIVLLGAVAFVLLIACANVGNLMLAKVMGRRKEIAIRTALGATRARVLQQVLAESVLLAIAGGALGLLLAHWGVALITNFLSSKMPRSLDISLDAGVLAFTAGISVFSGVIAGLAPALRLTRGDTNVNQALKQGIGRTDSDAGGKRMRSVLVGLEVALSLMLLIGAGLMIRTLWKLRGIDAGIDPHNVITMTLAVGQQKFSTPAKQIEFNNEVLRQVRALPGVQSAGVIDALPLSNGASHQPIAIEGRPAASLSEQPEVFTFVISPGYLSAMHIPLLRGRDVSDRDNADAPGAILVSEAMAKHFWPGEDVIGKRLTDTFFPDKVREVVGVVGDVRQDGLDIAPPDTMYLPLGQLSTPTQFGWHSFPMSLVARTASNPASLVSAITQAVHRVDAEVPVTTIITMDDFVAESLSQQRFNMLLMASFAGLAVLLAAVGIYSVLSYSVRRRVREIGIRMALGAQIGDVLRLVVLEGMTPALIGLASGLAGALALGRILSRLVYGVSATDPATFAAVSCLLALVAFAASIVPAYRATRLDPLTTLREE